MNTSMRGRLAAALSCLWLAACGGDGGGPPPTPPVKLPATVDITASSRASAGEASIFLAQSNTVDTTGLTFAWNWGDGNTGTSKLPVAQHTFAAIGDYVVTLTITNSAGDARTATRNVTVRNYGNTFGRLCTGDVYDGWCWQDTHVVPYGIHKWFFVDALHGWGVGENGTAVNTLDGGLTWFIQSSGTHTTDLLSDVRFLDTVHGIATSDAGALLRTDNGGLSWTRNAVGGLLQDTGWPTRIVRYDAGAIVLSQDNGSATSVTAVSRDGGATWASIPMLKPLVAGEDCWSVDLFTVKHSVGCTAAPTDVLFVANRANDTDLRTGAFVSATDGLLLGWETASGWNHAQGWATTDGGTTWTTFAAGGLPDNFDGVLRRVDATHAWIVDPYVNDWGWFGTPATAAYWTSDSGRTWTTVTPPADVDAGSAAGTMSTDVLSNGRLWFAAGNRIASTADGGATWQEATVAGESVEYDYLLLGRQSFQAGLHVTVVSWLDANHITVSANGRLYVTSDGGQHWVHPVGPDGRDVDNYYTAVAFTDAKHGVMALDDGAVKVTTDGGQTWARQDIPTNQGMPVALHFNSATDGWMMMGGQLSHSTDGGTTWNVPTTPQPITGLVGMTWLDNTVGWAWTPTSFWRTGDGGTTWDPIGLRPPGGEPIASVAFSSPTTGVLFNAAGTLMRSVDGGAWTPIAGPGFSGRLVHTRGHVLWIVSDAVARSTDDGATWTPVAVPPAAFDDIAFSDDLHGWLISSDGTIAATTDGGTTWTPTLVGRYVRATSLFVLDNYTAWVGTADGQLLATSTGGH